MPKILKRFMNPAPNLYQFQPAAELNVGGAMNEHVFPRLEPEEMELYLEPETEAEPQQDFTQNPVDFARIQSEALLADARREAEEYKAQARAAFEAELEEVRRQAREEGFRQGYAEGAAQGAREGRAQMEQQALQQAEAIEAFLEEAARMRDQLLDDSREELKDLALTIAEKVIRVSLKGSGDILRRMVETATDKHKRCEWAHIYIADCDVRGSANTIPELTAALRHLSGRVRVIPMADDESGTCIVELPDVILDASVSTQLGNIREVLNNAPIEGGGG